MAHWELPWICPYFEVLQGSTTAIPKDPKIYRVDSV
jgi:hypothetical protein